MSVITPDSTLGEGQRSPAWAYSAVLEGQRKCVPCVCGENGACHGDLERPVEKDPYDGDE